MNGLFGHERSSADGHEALACSARSPAPAAAAALGCKIRLSHPETYRRQRRILCCSLRRASNSPAVKARQQQQQRRARLLAHHSFPVVCPKTRLVIHDVGEQPEDVYCMCVLRMVRQTSSKQAEGLPHTRAHALHAPHGARGCACFCPCDALSRWHKGSTRGPRGAHLTHSAPHSMQGDVSHVMDRIGSVSCHIPHSCRRRASCSIVSGANGDGIRRMLAACCA